MRSLIEGRFPQHGISGEEFDERVATSSYSWSLDPIDGTRSFMCGLPTWVTLIALLSDGEPVLGLVDAPCLDELYVGTASRTSMNRAGSTATLRTSGCSRLADARLSSTDPYLFQSAAAAAFKELTNASRTVRFGHDGYAFARLAAGTLDLVVECGLKPHDYNALIPVVRGAGGMIGDWLGEADFAAGNVIAAATPELYEAAVAIMREAN
jgi:myo-inositol-1(or 4)-monophosphatase